MRDIVQEDVEQPQLVPNAQPTGTIPVELMKPIEFLSTIGGLGVVSGVERKEQCRFADGFLDLVVEDGRAIHITRITPNCEFR